MAIVAEVDAHVGAAAGAAAPARCVIPGDHDFEPGDLGNYEAVSGAFRVVERAAVVQAVVSNPR